MLDFISLTRINNRIQCFQKWKFGNYIVRNFLQLWFFPLWNVVGLSTKSVYLYAESCIMELAYQLHGAVAPMVTCNVTSQACVSNDHGMTAAVSEMRRTESGWTVNSTDSPMLTSWSTSERGSWRSSVLNCRIWWRSKGETKSCTTQSFVQIFKKNNFDLKGSVFWIYRSELDRCWIALI